MNNIEQILIHAKDICEANGVKLTVKREKILRVLLAAKLPLSAYEIIELCRSEYDLRISPISIYRMLNVLESQSLIHKLKSANKYIACIHITCDHEHTSPQFLICYECGKVTELEVSNEMLKSLKMSITNAGFIAETMQLELDCLCLSCSERN